MKAARAATNSLSDFYLEAWIYAQVTRGEKGPLNDIAFRIDTVSGNFYHLATQLWERNPLCRWLTGKGNEPLSGISWALEPRGNPWRDSAEQRMAKDRYCRSEQQSSGLLEWNETSRRAFSTRPGVIRSSGFVCELCRTARPCPRQK